MFRLSASSFLLFSAVVVQLLARTYGAETCSNGFAGVQSGEICCAEECGTCGGEGCSQRPGGPLSCCMTEIRYMSEYCSTAGKAPCIVDDEMMMPPIMPPRMPPRMPPMMPEPEDFSFSYDMDPWYSDYMSDDATWCRGGIPGVESDNGDVCCALGCGRCGGPGCSRFGAPELDSFDCCVTEIKDFGESCAATGEAPCYIDEDDFKY